MLDKLKIILFGIARLQCHSLCLTRGIWSTHTNELRHHTSNNKPRPNNLLHTITKLNNNVNPLKSKNQPHNIIIPDTLNQQTNMITDPQTPNPATNSCHTPKHKTKSITHTINNHMSPPYLTIAPMMHMIPPPSHHSPWLMYTQISHHQSTQTSHRQSTQLSHVFQTPQE